MVFWGLLYVSRRPEKKNIKGSIHTRNRSLTIAYFSVYWAIYVVVGMKNMACTSTIRFLVGGVLARRLIF